MGRDTRLAAVVLAALGAVLLIAGVLGLAAGLYLSGWIHDRLPEITADSAAVGGAAFALGAALVGLAIVHLGLALAVVRTVRAMLLPAAVLSLGMTVAVAGWSVAALVSAAAGAVEPPPMLAAAGILALVAAAYALAARSVIRAWRSTRTRT
ncbi:MAG TPA: hypothetical protein VHK28_09595 [Candidatus Limnocylindria bacterium]|nr:hypothetical protein [Candidatus Limnocylindria bacterium]